MVRRTHRNLSVQDKVTSKAYTSHRHNINRFNKQNVLPKERTTPTIETTVSSVGKVETVGITEGVYVGLVGGGLVGGIAGGPVGALLGSVVGSAYAFLNSNHQKR